MPLLRLHLEFQTYQLSCQWYIVEVLRREAVDDEERELAGEIEQRDPKNYVTKEGFTEWQEDLLSTLKNLPEHESHLPD